MRTLILALAVSALILPGCSSPARTKTTPATTSVHRDTRERSVFEFTIEPAHPPAPEPKTEPEEAPPVADPPAPETTPEEKP